MSKRIAVLFPSLNGGGGAEAVCFWMLEALKDRYDISLITLTPEDLTPFDRMYGTNLAASSIKIVSPTPRALAPLVRMLFFRVGEFSRPRQHLLMRFYKRLQSRFDLSISAYNEMDLGEPGIQYLHDPPRSRVGSRFHQSWSGYSETQMRANVSLAPSAWMRDVFRQAYGASFESTVVHPPARASFRQIPWRERSDDFLCIARMSAEKNVEEAISILREVRRRHRVRLRILSAGGKWLYERRIKALARRHSDWVSLEIGLSDGAYRDALSRHKYGINTAPQEGFGISVAELVNAGCIPFVIGRGGQSEILNPARSHLLHNRAAAVERILSVLSDPARQEEARQQLNDRRGVFSVGRFQNQMRDIVDQYLSRPASGEQVCLQAGVHHANGAEKLER